MLLLVRRRHRPRGLRRCLRGRLRRRRCHRSVGHRRAAPQLRWPRSGHRSGSRIRPGRRRPLLPLLLHPFISLTHSLTHTQSPTRPSTRPPTRSLTLSHPLAHSPAHSSLSPRDPRPAKQHQRCRRRQRRRPMMLHPAAHGG